MTDEEMKDLILNLQIGSVIEIEATCIGGTYKEVGKYQGELKHNGFYAPGCGWWCSSLSDYGKDERECWEFYFTPKGRRRPYIMKIGYKVVNIRVI